MKKRKIFLWTVAIVFFLALAFLLTLEVRGQNSEADKNEVLRTLGLIGNLNTQRFHHERPQEPDSVWYQAELDQVQEMNGLSPYPAGTEIVLRIYASGGSEKAIRGHDSDLWQLRYYFAKEMCDKWQLKVVATDYRLGPPGKRGVAIIKKTSMPSLSHTEELVKLSEALSSEIKNAQQADEILFDQIKSNQKMIGKIWNYLSRQKKFGHAISVGYEYVLIGSETEFSVPILKYTSSQGLFGLEGHIGGLPAERINSQKTWNGVWGGLFFIRPYKHLKAGIGYVGISRFYEDFTWDSRHDCFWMNLEIGIPLGNNWDFGLSCGGVKSENWGSVISGSLSINW